MEARAEAGVRRMEAGWGVRTGEAVGFLEEVVLLGCSVSKVAGVEHCGSLQTVQGEGWKRTEKKQCYRFFHFYRKQKIFAATLS